MAGSTPDADRLRERLAAQNNAYATWRNRDACRDALARSGLPHMRSEAWRHTNVARWYATALADEAPSSAKRGEVAAPSTIAVAEFSAPCAASLAGGNLGAAFDLAEHPLAAVNGLLLDAGVVVHAPAQRHAEPVRIGCLGGAFQHVLVQVEAAAELVLIEEPSAFTHRIVEVIVGAGAKVRHLRRQAADDRRECSLVAVRVRDGGEYALAQVSRGADLRRNDIVVTLAEGARAAVTGAWRLDGRGHLDNQVALNHDGHSAFSRQTYRGVAEGHARAVINGRIHIAAGADGSDAALSAKNLIASDAAQVFAKPELEINASDVKCSHGATVGALDDDAVSYLRCRGIGEAEARRLLVRGFLREAIADEEGARMISLAA